MKNVLKLSVSVLFYGAALCAVFGSWFVLWEVYGPLMIGFWLLSCLTSASMYLVNPSHWSFGHLKAANLGLNIGLVAVLLPAVVMLIGWYALALFAGCVAIAFAHIKTRDDSPFDPAYGATMDWGTLTPR
jgi:hypothetical protein